MNEIQDLHNDHDRLTLTKLSTVLDLFVDGCRNNTRFLLFQQQERITTIPTAPKQDSETLGPIRVQVSYSERRQEMNWKGGAVMLSPNLQGTSPSTWQRRSVISAKFKGFLLRIPRLIRSE